MLRTLRLLQTYQLLARLRADSPWFRRNEELALSIVHLVVFLFVMTGIVYETQHWTNPDIRNYIDALYFTVTALTTTGFGDITLRGHHRPADLGSRDDLWRYLVSPPAALPSAAAQSPLLMPRLRPAAS